MAKTEKELQELKEEVQALEAKLAELSEEELEEVSGGRLRTGAPLPSGFSRII